ncbi:MAG: FKBP-type peptidyl-prolyl cis-trans isomerase [Verrucomicrobiales bacterium]|jgi:FKBP-type peptidyl-prolyl cis-trans isomerase|nr:FKBP-type peptidyl-prolyl cis-trans isomerase [Verrucomicrobiales bacterium]MDP4791780.1 FKBP-type peptidyl-prolyl cis-trans isomerase [Verrucomicrobiales bacterium]MDP4938193.1 FKBP-type peptidyl-prolyl cis-trans isomerase [Verrucomicrobiales bacterium]
MQKTLTSMTACLLVTLSTLLMTADNARAEEAKKPESLTERISYAYGLMISRQLKERGIEIDLAQFSSAFKTVVADGEPILTEDEVAAAFAENQKIIDAKNMSPEDKANMEAGEAFLAGNAKKEGVKTTKSGLQYVVINAGDGAKPKDTDEVTVHYHGTLIDGTVFDSSVERGEPATFPLNRVIPGWTEGVQLMPQGAKYKFFIPYDLAYAERGAGADIKPFSALVFEVELLKIAGAE